MIQDIIHKITGKKNNKYSSWLNQLFLGGAVFGIIDHAWNKELLLFSMKDLILGLFITMGILFVWSILVIIDKHKLKHGVTA